VRLTNAIPMNVGMRTTSGSIGAPNNFVETPLALARYNFILRRLHGSKAEDT
jgi:hypothetical protein